MQYSHASSCCNVLVLHYFLEIRVYVRYIYMKFSLVACGRDCKIRRNHNEAFKDVSLANLLQVRARTELGCLIRSRARDIGRVKVRVRVRAKARARAGLKIGKTIKL